MPLCFFNKLRWILTAVVVAIGASNASAQTAKTDFKSTPGLSDAFARAVRGFDKTAHGTFFASQPRQGYQAELSAKGALTLSTGKTRFGVSVTAFGRGSVRGQLGETTAKVGKDSSGWPQISFDRPQLSEWYVNEQSGLHHWLRVEKRPAAAGNLWVRLGVTGDVKLKSVSDTAVEVHGQSTVLTYGGLKVWDARGKVLPARLQVERQNIHIAVDDSTAVYPVTIDPEWTQETKIVATDKSQMDTFGYSVSISGSRAVVGVPNSDPGGITDSGAAYVFSRSTRGVWTQEAKLFASDRALDDNFGNAVSVDGDLALIGVRDSDPDGVDRAGAAYVFKRDALGVWTQEAKLTSSDKAVFDNLGYSVSLSGQRALVGMANSSPNGSSHAGAARIFVRSAQGVWSEAAKLTAPDKLSFDNFGNSVSLFGNRALVGALNSNPDGDSDAGAAYIFVENAGVWSFEAKLTSPNKAMGDNFGAAVSLAEGRAIVGCPRSAGGGFGGSGGKSASAHIFVRQANSWVSEQILAAPTSTSLDFFGFSVSISGDHAVVGAPLGSIGSSTNCGATYVFKRSGSLWNLVSSLFATDRFSDDQFGTSVSLDGFSAIVGSPDADPDAKTNSGAAYIFSIPSQLAVSFSSSTLPASDPVIGTVSTEFPAPTGGVVVSLSAGNPALTFPATVTIPQGATSATFTATANSVTTDTPVIVTASSPGYDNGTATVTVQPRIEASEFVSKTVQNTYYATNQHPVSVTMKNTGTTTWTRTTHRLVAMNPFNNTIWGRNDVLIPTGVSIAPGQSHTFAFNITAPTTAGNYNFQWQMRKVSPGVPTNFGQTSTNVLVSVLTGFNAEFFNQSVPTALEPGKKVDVQIVMRNRGSTTWTPDNVRLMSKTDPVKLFGKDSIQLLPGESIAPGQYKTFNFRIQAPAAEGDYAFKWQMRRLGVANFGPETPTVSIQVQPLYNSQFVSQTVPATMQTANSYPVSVTFTNTGTTTWAPGQYILYSQNAPGNNRWRVNAVPLPSSVAPGASVTFNFTVYAPLTPGTYNFQWRLRKSGTGDFGALSTNVPVVVTN